MHRRLLVIGEVHRHLDDAAVFERDAHRLDEAESAGAMTDGAGDLLRHVEPVGREIDVVGDERHARADNDCAGGGMRARRTEVGRPVRRRHLRGETLEFPPPDVLEIPPRRCRGRLFIQEHRNLESRGDFSGRVSRECHALGHRHALDGDERHHVHGAEARVLAGVRAQVDVSQGRGDQRDDRGLQWSGVAGHRQDRSIVCRVGRGIEDADAVDRSQRLDEGVDDVRAPAFADVGHAFDEGHALDGSR